MFLRSSRVTLPCVLVIAYLATTQAFPFDWFGLSNEVSKAKSAIEELYGKVKDSVFPAKYTPDQQFNYVAPVKGQDSRAPCPALNTLANHGYLNRNGRDITRAQLIQALMNRMGISAVAANILAGAALSKVGKNGVLDLADLAAHNVIEHDASLSRVDAALSNNHQADFNPARFAKLLTFSKDGKVLTLEDIARARVYFSADSKKNNPQFEWNTGLDTNAKGEAIVLTNVLGRNDEISIPYIKSFFEQEKFPDGWVTPPTFGLVQLIQKKFKLEGFMKKEGGQ